MLFLLYLDIDECKTLTNPCGLHEVCENTVATKTEPKGYKCPCVKGYEKDPKTGKCVGKTVSSSKID